MNTTQDQIIIYQSADGQAQLEVNLQEETVWLSQKQMSELFGKNLRTINEHIQNIFGEGELIEDSAIRKFRITAADGKQYLTNHYNLDVIISVGYRVKSQRGTQFRIWANQVLREYLLQGYTLNQKRLNEKGLQQLEATLELIRGAMHSKQLTSDEAQGLLQVVTEYADTWLTLQRYDENALHAPEGKAPEYQLTVADARLAIAELKNNLVKQQLTTEIFGYERGEGLAAIIGTIYQTFDGVDLYPSLQQKAANLLYLVIKDHPLTDGNKRSAALLFILFLQRNHHLRNANGQRKFNDQALTALALLVAQSDPTHKGQMIQLILTFVG